MAQTMLSVSNIGKVFWAKTVNTTTYMINRVYISKWQERTSYEVWKDRKPTAGYFHVFGSPCFILNDWEHLEKFNSKSDDFIFLGYPTSSKSFRVLQQAYKRAINQSMLLSTFLFKNMSMKIKLMFNMDTTTLVSNLKIQWLQI